LRSFRRLATANLALDHIEFTDAPDRLGRQRRAVRDVQVVEFPARVRLIQSAR
jgi:hypothetical protein